MSEKPSPVVGGSSLVGLGAAGVGWMGRMGASRSSRVIGLGGGVFGSRPESMKVTARIFHSLSGKSQEKTHRISRIRSSLFCRLKKGIRPTPNQQVLKELKKGTSIRRTAKLCDVSVSTVQRLKSEFRL